MNYCCSCSEQKVNSYAGSTLWKIFQDFVWTQNRIFWHKIERKRRRKKQSSPCVCLLRLNFWCLTLVRPRAWTKKKRKVSGRQSLSEVHDHSSGQVLFKRTELVGLAGVHLHFPRIAGPGVARNPYLDPVPGWFAGHVLPEQTPSCWWDDETQGDRERDRVQNVSEFHKHKGRKPNKSPEQKKKKNTKSTKNYIEEIQVSVPHVLIIIISHTHTHTNTNL